MEPNDEIPPNTPTWVTGPGTAPPYAAVPPGQPPSGPLPAEAARPRRRARTGFVVAAALLVGIGGGAGVTAAVVRDRTGSSASSTSVASGTGTSTGTGDGQDLPNGFNGFGRTVTQPGTSSAVTASAVQSVGVVDIDTVDGYQGAEAAGTGMVVTSSGEILTNNHVIDGATSIKVTVVATGKTYTAKVVGTSPKYDIAMLQLVNASGLKTANFGNSNTVSVRQAVTGVGNAGGAGGTPSAARGTITALGKKITASSEDGSGSETLRAMIVTNAPIASGDSGGPLYNSANQVIGIDTAAASGSGTTRGYAIPINRALSIASRIEAGNASATIHLGYPAFLGVELVPGSTEPLIARTVRGGAAASAGLRAGDTITAVDGTPIRTYAQLHRLLAQHKPGDTIRVTYRTSAGRMHTAPVTLKAGPAD